MEKKTQTRAMPIRGKTQTEAIWTILMYLLDCSKLIPLLMEVFLEKWKNDKLARSNKLSWPIVHEPSCLLSRQTVDLYTLIVIIKWTNKLSQGHEKVRKWYHSL